MVEDGKREGSLEAPKRHPLDWQNPAFYDQDGLFKELERVFDICHGCRRCFENGLNQPKQPAHPMALLRKAYGI